jgi:glutathione S-transferase
MKPIFYAHPFSSYCQKALIALYENGTDFDYRSLETAEANAELEALWPLKKFPVLVDAGKTILEASIIVEHLDIHHPGPVRLVPQDAAAALEVRTMDRIFDNYVMSPMGKIVGDALRAEGEKDLRGVADARASLERIYAWLDKVLSGRTWAAGSDFSLADCAAAPSLLYADWAHPIPEAHATLKAYRARLLARPSFARAVDEARYFRPNFPLGAPDRD